MPSPRLPVLAVMLVLGLGAAACGGDDKTDKPEAKPQPSAPVVTGPGSDPTENVATADQLFAAIASADAAQLADAADLVAPKSNAAAYVADLRSRVVRDASVPVRTVETVSPGRFELCTKKDDCLTVSDVVLVDGKVLDFSVDGKPISRK